MILKKWTSVLAVLAIGAVLLTGCSNDAADSSATTDTSDSSEAVSTTDVADLTVDALYNMIVDANPISNPRELDDMTITLDFMISSDDVASYTGIASNDGGDAGMVVVIEAVEGKADAIFETLETYASNQVSFWSNYEEFADAKASVEEARVVCEGNFIIAVFASNEADYADIDAALSAALG